MITEINMDDKKRQNILNKHKDKTEEDKKEK